MQKKIEHRGLQKEASRFLPLSLDRISLFPFNVHPKFRAPIAKSARPMGERGFLLRQKNALVRLLKNVAFTTDKVLGKYWFGFVDLPAQEAKGE